MGWLQSLFGSSSSDETPVTLEALQGKWKMVGVGKNGNFAPPTMVANMKIYMTIDGDHYTVIADGTVGDQGTIKLDTTQNPVHFDQHITQGDEAGHAHLGLIRIRDGVLENLQGDTGAPRPKKFAAKWKDGASLASFRRVKTN